MCFAHTEDNFDPNQLFLRSSWEPDKDTVPIEFRARVSHFLKLLQNQFRRRQVPPNLSHYQASILENLKSSEDFQVFPSDKNLGPCIIEKSEYILRVLAHLSDTTTYKQLSKNAAEIKMAEVETFIESFLFIHSRQITYADQTYIDRSLEVPDKFAHFYMMAKVHKTPWTVRPIVSVSGSLTHGLGRWLDQQLKPLVRKLPSYIESSFQLKNRLSRLDVDLSNVSLFTCDAVSMYTNIDTDHALEVIARFLRTSPLCIGAPSAAIISALEIIMRNNVFRFGDTFWHQQQGTAMGTPPAPPYATLYFGIHEIDILALFNNMLPSYSRYIDDVLAAWIHHPNPSIDRQNFLAFQASMNSFGTLVWEFTPLEKQVDFMDLTVSVTPLGIHTRLFEKPLNLYLYIPPHSAHAPGILRGLVFGMTGRIFRLTSHWRDQQSAVRHLFLRLCKRGYTSTQLRPIFKAALARIDNPPLPDPWFHEKRCFLHLPFHPNDPRSSTVQRLFREHMLSPRGEPELPELENPIGAQIRTNRLIVAYHRPSNLKNLLFPRIFRTPADRPVSSFMLATAPAAGL
jgi:hypothetical protein